MTEAQRQRYLRHNRKRAQRALRAGACLVCFAPCAINPRTGKPYRRCPVHLARAAQVQHAQNAQRRERWAAAGLCQDCGAPVHHDLTTKRPFKRCFDHLRQNAIYQATRRQTQKETAHARPADCHRDLAQDPVHQVAR